MAERHVREGAERIARQRKLIETITSKAHEDLLLNAESLLAEMENLQDMSEEHLARFKSEAAAALLRTPEA